jgi:hypothetical protein
MRNTQLSCPYCGSLLTFNQDVAAGTYVPCLICGQSFPANPTAAPPQPAYVPPPPKPEPPPVARPAAPAAVVAPTPPAARPAEVKPAPFILARAEPPKAAVPPPVPKKPAPRPAAPPRPAPSGGGLRWLGGLALAAVVLCLFGTLLALVWINVLAVRMNDTDAPPAVAQAADTETSEPGSETEPPMPGPNPAPAAIDDGGDLDVPPEPKTPTEKKRPLVTRRVEGNAKKIDVAALPVVTITRHKPSAAGVTQERVDAAIARGVRYLKALDRGAPPPFVLTSQPERLGLTALVGLTLLECDVPAGDPTVQRIALAVRGQSPGNTSTYDVALSILFLDRLGEGRDRLLIQTLAVRLLAAQTFGGGWSYNCHPLAAPETQHLYAYLQSHRPASALPKAATKSDRPPAPDKQATSGTSQKIDDPLVKDAPQEKDAADAATAKQTKPPARKKTPPVPVQNLPARLQTLPIVQFQSKGMALFGPQQGMMGLVREGMSDNSNTQFALLALWAARRLDVPTDVALLFGYRRFAASQFQDGGWAYHSTMYPGAGAGGGSSPAMTCVGLLGLAMGHGAAPVDGKDKGTKQDPFIQKGLTALGQSIGTPSKDPNARPHVPSLYYLWSVERVAVLYELNTIGGKDWYGWGAQMLLNSQQQNGCWNTGGYPSATPDVDTCFALLFLRRSNLVRDLTENLRLFMAIRDPEATP